MNQQKGYNHVSSLLIAVPSALNSLSAYSKAHLPLAYRWGCIFSISTVRNRKKCSVLPTNRHESPPAIRTPRVMVNGITKCSLVAYSQMADRARYELSKSSGAVYLKCFFFGIWYCDVYPWTNNLLISTFNHLISTVSPWPSMGPIIRQPRSQKRGE